MNCDDDDDYGGGGDGDGIVVSSPRSSPFLT